ncbi:MAG TPA: hypothetical protein VFA45_19100, partial [Actinomycetes bacterium]|nr:hypothetical protein [Actinomycetes bacterium]
PLDQRPAGLGAQGGTAGLEPVAPALLLGGAGTTASGSGPALLGRGAGPLRLALALLALRTS